MSDSLVSAYAPGRVELLGNHTDYNDGVVLGGAIDCGLTVAGTRRDDQVVALRSDTMGAVELDSRNLHPLKTNRWANYILGVAHELAALGVPVGGFAAEISGDLPARSGLSSSAALEVATALFLLKLSGKALAPLEIAKACQRAEHRFAGVKSGLLDQVTSLFGKRDHAVFFDARTEEVRTVPFPPGLAVVIVDSGKKRELTSGAYNERRAEAEAAAEALGVRALRDITLAQLEQRRDIPDLLRRRAAHVIGENERVWRAIELLQAGDGAGFGALLNQSHESSRRNFENSTPELDRLVAIAQELPGVLGSRLTGAGFGGATITLCERSAAQSVATELAQRYASACGITPSVLISELADGAH